MLVAAALSDDGDALAAVDDVLAQVVDDLDGAVPDLAVLFVSAHHQPWFGAIAEGVERRLAPEVLIGGVAQGVIGPGAEVEAGPAVSLWAASFDGVGEVLPFRSWVLPAEQGVTIAGVPDTRPDDVVLLLADPFTYPTSEVVARLGSERPGHRILGGLVTGGPDRGGLLLGTDVHDAGAVGAVLRGVSVDVVVSQGCRPVGDPFVVTKADRNVIYELGGEPAVDRLRALFATAAPEDRRLIERGLHVGIVADEYRDDFDTGDFLIRGVMGADEETGGVAVGDHVELGRIVQFQVRDAASAQADLAERLGRLGHVGRGALLFTCNGRGERFFGHPGHDVAAVEGVATGGVAGAFCAGEVGPVGPHSFVHGFTASVAVFGEPRDAASAGPAETDGEV